MLGWNDVVHILYFRFGITFKHDIQFQSIGIFKTEGFPSKHIHNFIADVIFAEADLPIIFRALRNLKSYIYYFSNTGFPF